MKVKYKGKIYKLVDSDDSLKIVETGIRDIEEVETRCKEYRKRLDWCKKKMGNGEIDTSTIQLLNSVIGKILSLKRAL